MFRNQSVNAHQFAMVPRADIPRSSFRMEHAHKTTFDAGYLVPVYVDEVLPGDSFSLSMTAFARLATPLFPLMDNMYLDSFFFFVPNRLLWTNWKRFMGEQDNPGDSTDYTIPQIVSPAGGYPINSLSDYMGLPTVGQVGATATVTHGAFWHRAYNLVWNEWFRDENLQDSIPKNVGDGPDNNADFVLKRRGKRHDYFTGSLPWPQKGAAVPLPLGSSAPVYGPFQVQGADNANLGSLYQNTSSVVATTGPAGATSNVLWSRSTGSWENIQGGLFADLTQATAATINQLRQSFQVQKLLERDARGGTRYTEIVRSHFGVVSPDARLQRPEYLGGGSTPVAINPIAQTSATLSNESASTTPQGNLAAMGTILSQGHGFSQSFTEHGVVIGLVSVRADLSYQQGMRKMWSRKTRYDFFWPVFSMLGEQTVLNREIYCDGSASDSDVWGYQERWAEYRYNPSIITGLFRSTANGTLDAWHLSQHFTSRPTLNNQFIADTPPVERIVAVGDAANGQQFIFDSFFRVKAARPMPLYSVPGLIDHF